MLRRILKMLSVLGASFGIALVTQLLLPPLFLHFYGVSKYGEWLVLSATISYLSTLNLGITTYASNELTMLHKRGEMNRYRELQGSTFALLLCAICGGLVITSIISFLPLSRLLHLSTIGSKEVRLAAFFLGLQVMTNILGGYCNNLYMVVEETHRGFAWATARTVAATLSCAFLVTLRVEFSVLAIGQFVAASIVTMLTIYDLKRQMGGLPLGLGGANRRTARAILAPSGMFGMIYTQTFLIYQAPLIILQRILGPQVVVLFSISRTIFSTARQMLSPITSAISPEITFSFANRDMKKMLSIFHFSEKVVFAGIPVANLGAFLFSPLLLQIWLHKPFLFDPPTYGLMTLVSGAMSMREHKQFFQYSTNTHKRLSFIVFFGNLLMIAVSVPLTIEFGLFGFMCTWLVSEVTQMGLLYHENRKLFNFDSTINLIPVIKLAIIMLVSLPICAVIVRLALQRSLFAVGSVAAAGTLMLVAVSYFVFGLGEVRSEFQHRMQRREKQV